jgi:hypothetical protein
MRMERRKKLGITIAAVAAVVLAALLAVYFQRRHPTTLQGAVTLQDSDTRNQLPIADVEVTAVDGTASAPVKTDSSGYFKLRLRQRLLKSRPVILQFRHPDYHPLDVKDVVGDKLYVVRMAPLARKENNIGNQPAITVGNIRVRYSTKALRSVNIGSAVKTFQVENVGNVPCQGQSTCSPDGKWKAAIASASLDAGPGNEFHNSRVSCIAGPCAFTKIESDNFTEGGRTISASARNWSDTAMFLMEAEVSHPMVSPIDHQSYPVIFGQALNFTLPPAVEGVSIEADIAGETIIFPFGPELILSWANCNVHVNRDQTRVYRCELKRGYRFKN